MRAGGAGPGAQRLVLVVDDDADLVQILTDRLEVAGYRVLTAGDGVEALDRLETAQPACVILDLKMPRLGGLDALPWIRRAAPDAYVIVLTGSPNRPLADECRAQGAHDFLLKPFEAGERLRRLARAFARD
ncbi:MAG TPA: response regulator [Methylomirabilota bacterium]|nr:response regulator [Methylomirabilota bacterium]